VDGGTPPYICYQGGTCVPKCGKCTFTADCCPGETCLATPGSADGVCGPCVPPPDGGPDSGGSSSGTTTSSGGTTTSSGGTTTSSGGTTTSSGGTTTSSGGTTTSSSGSPCALYGQQCQTISDCCNEVPCNDINGTTCAAGEAGCTCHFPTQ
jgi:hypothetical protein